MKAERLLMLLAMLQRTQTSTASELATRLGVSVRTVFRYIDALSVAGVPVYGLAGQGGGIRVSADYRTARLPLSLDESEALALVGIPTGATSAELDRSMRAAIDKLLTTIPAIHASRATHARERMLFDPRPWFHALSAPQLLDKLRAAVWEDRWVDALYESRDGSARMRRLAPHALVIKVDAWYLVAREKNMTKVFHVSRLRDVHIRDLNFKRMEKFDLPRFWSHWCEEFESHPPNQYLVDVELSSRGRQMLLDSHRHWLGRTLEPLAEQCEHVRVTLDLQREDIACRVLAAVAEHVRVRSPERLRDRLRATASALLRALE